MAVNLPYSREAEKEVLGAMLVSKDALINSVVRLSENDFYDNDHKIVFSTIKNVYERINDFSNVSTIVNTFNLGVAVDELNKDRNVKKAIYLDEIWRLIGVTSNKEVAKFIYKIFKTIENMEEVV